MFRDGQSATGGHQGGHGTDVKGSKPVAAGTAGIGQVLELGSALAQEGSLFAAQYRGTAGDFLCAGPLGGEGGQHGCHSGGVQGSFGKFFHKGFRFLLGQMFTPQGLFKGTFKSKGFPPVVQKGPDKGFPFGTGDRFRMELNTFYGKAPVPQTHDVPIAGAGGNFQFGAQAFLGYH
jgi:hypothetical protein